MKIIYEVADVSGLKHNLRYQLIYFGTHSSAEKIFFERTDTKSASFY